MSCMESMTIPSVFTLLIDRPTRPERKGITMTREEYNEFRYIRANLRKYGTGNGTTCTIRTDASPEYKHRLDALYSEHNMHPASIRIDSTMYDEKQRIIYIYGRDEVFTDYYGRTFTWSDLYTADEKKRFADALN